MFWFCVSQSDYRKSYIQKWISPELLTVKVATVFLQTVSREIHRDDLYFNLDLLQLLHGAIAM